MASHVVVAPNRNVRLESLVGMLRDQSTRAVDVIAGAGAIRAVDANLIVNGTEPQIGPNGVTMTAGTYTINEIAQNGIAEKLAIPIAYLRRMAEDNVDLYDTNVNSWLARTDRRFLIRCLRNDAGHGVVRAFLSDSYYRIDNLDVLMAALSGIRDAGMSVEVAGCDLTDRRMYLRVVSPEVRVVAPRLCWRTTGHRSTAAEAASCRSSRAGS
jgi:hypothetical protein